MSLRAYLILYSHRRHGFQIGRALAHPDPLKEVYAFS